MRADVTSVNWGRLTQPDSGFFAGLLGSLGGGTEDSFRSKMSATTASPTSVRLASVLPRLLHNKLAELTKTPDFTGFEMEVACRSEQDHYTYFRHCINTFSPLKGDKNVSTGCQVM